MGLQHFVGVERGVISEQDLVGGEPGSGVDPIVVYHCGKCKPVCPSFWVVRRYQSEVLFDPLVLSFGQSVGLGVKCHG